MEREKMKMNKTFGNDFEEDVKIDRFKLEEENEIQPMIYSYWAKQYAEARTIKDEQEDKLDLIVAQRGMFIRENPPPDVKITEGTISSLLAQDADVLAQKECVRAANANMYMFQAAMGGLDSRKAALDNLTSLYAKNYYQNSIRTGTDEIRDELNSGLRSKK
jgi:hypothetical protein